MPIDGKKLIDQQLSLIDPTVVEFPNGKKTPLFPVHYTPLCNDLNSQLSLNGTWQVSRYPFKRSETGLASPKTSDTSWESAEQPGKICYANAEINPDTVKGWSRVTWAHINNDDGAVIRRTVKIPSKWKGKKIILRFDGIYPASRIYLNGQPLGEHLSGLTPIEFEVTKKVTPGKDALVAVRLLRKHRFVQLDMPRHSVEFAGLSQPAYFFSVEQTYIADYHLVSSLDARLTTGTLGGHLLLKNDSSIKRSGSLSITIANAAGKKVASTTAKTALPANGQKIVSASLTVPKPALWNDEFPNLYTVTMVLKIAGHADQIVTYQTGFRKFEFINERPVLNGNPVKFRGVNHLTFHPEGGMYTSKEWLRKNLTLMKKANVNAIRTHFLGPRVLAEVCDELGIYLMQELPIDWGTDYIHDPEWVGPALMRIHGGVLRDRHHCSVMVWCIGNENMPNTKEHSADGYYHLRMYDTFAKILDPTRPTMFPPPGPANKIKGIFETRVGDVADTHYSFNLVKEFQETGMLQNPIAWTAEHETCTHAQALERGWSGVWFSSEYGIANNIPDLMNAPYTSVIDDVKEDWTSGKNTMQVFLDRLKREWGYMRGDPSCLGGAYFPWLCSGAGNNPWGWVLWGEDNDWGIVTADLTVKPQFWGLRVLFSPVWFPEYVEWKKGDTAISFTITNQYNAIDLSDCILRTQMGGSGEWMGCLRNWRDVKIACKPGQTKEVSIPLWNADSIKNLDEGNTILVRCILLDPRGFRPVTHDILVMPETVAREKRGPSSASAALKTTKDEMLIGPDAIL